jgi:hypothetical protein
VPKSSLRVRPLECLILGAIVRNGTPLNCTSAGDVDHELGELGRIRADVTRLGFVRPLNELVDSNLS